MLLNSCTVFFCLISLKFSSTPSATWQSQFKDSNIKISAHYIDITSKNAMRNQSTSIFYLPCTSTSWLIISDHLLNYFMRFFTMDVKKEASSIDIHCEVHVGQRNRRSPQAQAHTHITTNMAERISFTSISEFFLRYRSVSEHREELHIKCTIFWDKTSCGPLKSTDVSEEYITSIFSVEE
jgi:hypothetical protein